MPGWITEGPRAHVEEIRHAHAVEEVADVAGRRAAHVEERQAGDDRRHAGQGLDRAERIAERARQLANLGAPQRRRARRRAKAAHRDLVGRRRARRRAGPPRRRWGWLGLGLRDDRGMEEDLHLDARRDRLAVTRGGVERPALRRAHGRASERLVSRGHLHVVDGAVDPDRDGHDDDAVARGALRIVGGRCRTLPRRHDRDARRVGAGRGLRVHAPGQRDQRERCREGADQPSGA